MINKIRAIWHIILGHHVMYHREITLEIYDEENTYLYGTVNFD